MQTTAHRGATPGRGVKANQGRLHISCCGSGTVPSLLAGAPQAAGGDLAGLSVLRVDSARQLRADCALLQKRTHGKGHLPLWGQPAQLQRGQLGLVGAPLLSACTSKQSRVPKRSSEHSVARGRSSRNYWSGLTPDSPNAAGTLTAEARACLASVKEQGWVLT